MKDHFKPTQTAAKTANKLANTNAFAGLADDDADDAASITSIKSNASNNSYAGAVRNTNTPDTNPVTNPVNLEGTVGMTLNKDPEGTWTPVPTNKSPPRANEKRNRVSTPTKKKQSDTTTKKAARKQVQNPMSTTPDRSEHHKKQNPSVVTGEKPGKPLPTPPESPPKLDRNPRLPEAAITPQSLPDHSSNQQANATPKNNHNESHDPKKDVKTAPTQGKGKSNPNKGKNNKNKNGKGNRRNKKQQVKFMVHPYAINTKAPATKSYYTLIKWPRSS